jgi:carbon starvation protein
MGKARFAWVTLVPLGWLAAVTMTASVEKIWHPNPRIGFLAHARFLGEQLAAGTVATDKLVETQRLIFNDRLDAAVTFIFAALVVVILVESGRHWWLYLGGRTTPVLTEAPMELSKLLTPGE